MSAVDWALTRNLNAPKKLLLVTLAWICDDAGVTFKGQKTIAERMAKDPRWVRAHLPELAAEGYVTRYRRHRLNGARTSDLLVLNMPRSEPVDLSHYSGLLGDREIGDHEPSGGIPPGGQAAGTGQPSGGIPPGHTSKPVDRPVAERENAHARDPRELPPDDFPEELRPHAREVCRILVAVARDHPAAKRVWPRAVGLAVMSHPRHPLVATAHALAGWAVDPPRPLVDVVGTYRTFLGRERELAAPEQLAADGTPSATPRQPPEGVTRLQPRSVSELKYLDKREREQRGIDALERVMAAQREAPNPSDIEGEATEL